MSATVSVKCAFCDHTELVSVTLTLSGLHEGYVGVRAEVPTKAATVAEERFREHLASVHSVMVVGTAKWPTVIPGADAAAWTGIRLANRSIQRAGQEAAEAAARLDEERRITDAIQSGEHASKGAARRAFGINEGIPPIDGSAWFQRIAAGLTGASPALSNVGPAITRPTRRWWQFWKRANV